MVRGRSTARGTRRGAAASGRRADAGGGDDDGVMVKEEPSSTATPTTFPTASSAGSESAPVASMTVRRAAAAAAAATTTTTMRGTRGATSASGAGRFRPRAIRRDETERDALAQKEQQKAEERAADERRARGRSRFRSKRSRGDAMGSRGGRPVAGASGPFAGGPGIAGGARTGGGWFGGGGGGIGGPGGGGGGGFLGGKSEPKGSGFGFAGAGGYREPRINADKLHAMTHHEDLDSDDEAMIAALRSKGGSAMPMGIYRKEHKETPVIVATTAELEAQEKAANGLQQDGDGDGDGLVVEEEESLWVEGSGPPVEQLEDEDEVEGDGEQGPQGQEGGERPVVVKQEPTDDDTMALDPDVRPVTGAEPPEGTGNGKQPAAGRSTTTSSTTTTTTTTTTATKKKKKTVLQDTEESMIRTDLSLLASELGAVALTSDDGASKGEVPTSSNKDGRLYLFQFPPLLPPLRQISNPRKARSRVKSEAAAAQPISLRSTPAAGTKTPVDLTRDHQAHEIRDDHKDDDDEHDDDEEEEEEEDDDEDDDEQDEKAGGGRGTSKRGFGSQMLSRGGLIGKLNVRRSGKVELDWGGQILEMSPAAGMSFLTTAVIVEESDEKPQNGVTGGESIGMGKIMGRFVLAPIWSEEEEWDVPPEELVVEG